MNKLQLPNIPNLNPVAAYRNYRAKKAASKTNSQQSIQIAATQENSIPLKDMDLKNISAKDIYREFKVTRTDRVKTALSITARYTTAGAVAGAVYGSAAAVVTGQVEAIPAGVAIGGGIGLAGGLYTGCRQAYRLTPEVKLKNRLIKVRNKCVPMVRKYNLARFTSECIMNTIRKEYSDRNIYDKNNRPETQAEWDELHLKIKNHRTELEGIEKPCRATRKLQKRLKQLDKKMTLISDLHKDISKISPEKARLEDLIKILEQDKKQSDE